MCFVFFYTYQCETAPHGGINVGALASRLKINPNDPYSHITHPLFGVTKDVKRRREQLEHVHATMPSMPPSDAELVTRVLYDQGYGNYTAEQMIERPMAAMGYHPQEDLIEGSYLYSLIRTFHRYEIHKEFGITLTDFLNMPRHVSELIVDMCEMARRLKDKAAKGMNDDLDSSMK